jgi:hypothetical protein
VANAVQVMGVSAITGNVVLAAKTTVSGSAAAEGRGRSVLQRGRAGEADDEQNRRKQRAAKRCRIAHMGILLLRPS